MDEFSQQDEQAFILRAQSDPQAFRPLYHYYHPRIFAYVAYRVGAAEDAEDITAEVFMRAVSGLAGFTYRGEGAFSAWLFQIAHNEVRRHYGRRQKDSAALSLDDLPEIESDSPPVDQQVQRKEQFAALRDLIERLSPRQQEIVTLKFFGELRNREIAAVLSLDERTVAAHLSRALNELQRLYSLESALSSAPHRKEHGPYEPES